MKVIIIGGGIGGLCTALAMRTQGIDAVIYERAPEPGDVGAGLMLWPNAMKVLSALGAGAAVIAAGARLIHSRLCTANGKTLHEGRLDELETRVGTPVVAIHRAALHRILAEDWKPACSGLRCPVSMSYSTPIRSPFSLQTAHPTAQISLLAQMGFARLCAGRCFPTFNCVIRDIPPGAASWRPPMKLRWV